MFIQESLLKEMHLDLILFTCTITYCNALPLIRIITHELWMSFLVKLNYIHLNLTCPCVLFREPFSLHINFTGTDTQAILGKGHVQLPGHLKKNACCKTSYTS